jgi:hypothetical protein
VALAGRIGHVLIGTADVQGLPHIAAAASLEQTDATHVAVTEWFCPGTIENLKANPLVSVVVWDNETDTGFQLLGTSESMDQVAILDGYTPKEKEGPVIPQVERKISLRVEKIVDFRHAPHSDLEE